MIMTTTGRVEGRPIIEYRGIVVGEAIMGANVVRDFFASITDVVGGRSGAYESKLQDARSTAMLELEERAAELGATAVVGIDLDYEVVGDSMLMVSASGTAVVLGQVSGSPLIPALWRHSRRQLARCLASVFGVGWGVRYWPAQVWAKRRGASALCDDAERRAV